MIILVKLETIQKIYVQVIRSKHKFSKNLMQGTKP